MVCTDAAARGIDIPNVTHVIQAEFAASAVEFLHRVSFVHEQGVLTDCFLPILQCLLCSSYARRHATWQLFEIEWSKAS